MIPNVLTIILFLPVVAAIILAILPRGSENLMRLVALAFTGANLLLALVLFFSFDTGKSGLQFVERASWVRLAGFGPQGFNIDYSLGVDGLSLPLVVLTSILFFLAVIISWKPIQTRVKEYFALTLLLQTGVMGVFVSLDFFLFFLFWEVELIPMYLLIGIWGSGRREYAATKFLIYTIVGSAFMLAGILWLYFSAGLGTFDLLRLGADGRAALTTELATALFFLLFFGYAIKLPVFPFHTWLPDAHTEAPTAVSVLLAGILLKMGGYAMIRICVGIFPDVARTYAPLLAVIAVIGVLYGAGVAMVQNDMKRLIAYSSVSHMGYVLLAIAAGAGVVGGNQVAMSGAVVQMFTHGTITGLLFTMMGVVYDHAHTRQIHQMGGLAHRMKFAAVLFYIAGFASVGLPALSGFVGELLVFLGSYEVFNWAAILAVIGVLLSAGYILWSLQRAMWGPERPSVHIDGEVTAIERVAPLTLAAIILLVGIYPSILTNVVNSFVPGFLARLGGG